MESKRWSRHKLSDRERLVRVFASPGCSHLTPALHRLDRNVCWQRSQHPSCASTGGVVIPTDVSYPGAMAKGQRKLTVTHNPGDAYEMSLTIAGDVDQDADVFVRELLALAAQAALPLLRGDFDGHVMDVLEEKFRDREFRASAPSEFDQGFEAGKNEGVEAPQAAAGLSVDDLNALPHGAEVMDWEGDVWVRDDDEWGYTTGLTLDSDELVEEYGPLLLVDNPSES